MDVDVSLLRASNVSAGVQVTAALAVGLSSRWMLLGLTPFLIRMLSMRRFYSVFGVVLAGGLADLLVARILKPWFHRDRPCRILTDLILPVGCGPGLGFPSGHAAVSFALCLAIQPIHRWQSVTLLVLPLLVSLSRVVLGVHFPSDVFAGSLIGALLGLTARRLGSTLDAGRIRSTD
jgi:membrane-associated phospholipid phosphatase